MPEAVRRLFKEEFEAERNAGRMEGREEGRMEGREEGRMEGREEKRIKVYERMRAANIPEEQARAIAFG